MNRLDENIISKITGVTIEEIEKIKRELDT